MDSSQRVLGTKLETGKTSECVKRDFSLACAEAYIASRNHSGIKLKTHIRHQENDSKSYREQLIVLLYTIFKKTLQKKIIIDQKKNSFHRL